MCREATRRAGDDDQQPDDFAPLQPLRGGCGPGGRGFESPRSPLTKAPLVRGFSSLRRGRSGRCGHETGTNFFSRASLNRAVRRDANLRKVKAIHALRRAMQAFNSLDDQDPQWPCCSR